MGPVAETPAEAPGPRALPNIVEEYAALQAEEDRLQAEWQQDLAAQAALAELDAAREKVNALRQPWEEKLEPVTVRKQQLRIEILQGWADPSTKTIKGDGWRVQLRESLKFDVLDPVALVQRLAELKIAAKGVKEVKFDHATLKSCLELNLVGLDLVRPDRTLQLAITLRERDA